MSATQLRGEEAQSWVPEPAVAPTRARIARALFLRAVRTLPEGSLTVILPDGRAAVAGRPDAPTMTVHREDFFHRLQLSTASDNTRVALPSLMRKMPFCSSFSGLLPAPRNPKSLSVR